MDIDLQRTITSICKAVILKALPNGSYDISDLNKSAIGNYWGLNFDDARILPPEVDTCATCYCVSMLAESQSLKAEDLNEDIVDERDKKLVLGIKTILNVRNADGFWPATVRMDKKIENDSKNYSASVGDSYFALNALMDSGFLDRDWYINKLADKHEIDLNIDMRGINNRINYISKTIEWLNKVVIRSGTMRTPKGLPFNVVEKDGELQRSGPYADRNIPATTVTVNLMLVFIKVIKALNKLDPLVIEKAAELKASVETFYKSLIKNLLGTGANIVEYGTQCSPKNNVTLIATARLLDLLIADEDFSEKANHKAEIARVYNTLIERLPIASNNGQDRLDFSSTIISDPASYIETYKISYMSDNQWYEEMILHENFIEGILANTFISLHKYCHAHNHELGELRNHSIEDFIKMCIENIFLRCKQITITDEDLSVCMGYVPRSSGFYPVYTSYLAYYAMRGFSDIFDKSQDETNGIALDNILNIKNNRSYFEGLKRDMNNVVPFIGAGLSVPLGYPLWDSALSTLRKLCSLDEAEDEIISDLIAKGSYFDAAEKIKKHMKNDAFYEAVRACFDDRQRKEGALSDYPIGLVPTLFDNRLIITTNFDRAIETAYADVGLPLEKVTPIQALIPSDQRLINYTAEHRSILFKMHGDYEVGEGIIFDAASYDTYYGAKGSKEKTRLVDLLAMVLKSKHLLFLGASLMQDRTMDVIRNVVESSETSPWHYAIIECDITNKNALNDREKELSALRIHPIFFPVGQYECIKVLFDALLADKKANGGR